MLHLSDCLWFGIVCAAVTGMQFTLRLINTEKIAEKWPVRKQQVSLLAHLISQKVIRSAWATEHDTQPDKHQTHFPITAGDMHCSLPCVNDVHIILYYVIGAHGLARPSYLIPAHNEWCIVVFLSFFFFCNKIAFR